MNSFISIELIKSLTVIVVHSLYINNEHTVYRVARTN